MNGEQVVRQGADSSPCDLDARYPEKHGRSWLGYKAHFTGTCSKAADDDPVTGCPPAPSLITGVATTRASVPDAAMTAPARDMLDAAGLLPGEHAGYTSADLLLAARARGITLPVPAACQRLAPGTDRRIRHRRFHHRLGAPAGHLPPRRP